MSDVYTDRAVERQVLADLRPYDPGAGAEVQLCVGTRGFTTEPGDDPANKFFMPVLRSRVGFQRSLFSPGRVGGRSIPQRGEIEIVNTGEFDDWLGYSWDERSIAVWVGVVGAPWAEHVKVLDGVLDEIDYTRNAIVLRVRDRKHVLDRPVQETLYAGSGGTEGGSDLEGKPKPRCFGKAVNLTPVLVDRSTWTYQVNDGQIDALSAVYQGGAALGGVVADLANGRFSLPGAPTGLITCTVRGDKAGGTYVTTVADIVRRLVTTYGPLTDPDDLDVASFDALNALNPAPVNLWVDREANLLDVLDELVATVGGWYGFNRAGKLCVGRLDAPAATADLMLDANDVVRDTIERQSTGAPRWRQRIDYARNWTVQDASSIAPGSAVLGADFLEQAFRTVKAEDAAIKTVHLGAIDPDPLATLFDVEADAQAEADRRLALYKVRRDLFKLTAKTQPLQIDLGQTVRLTHNRFGLSQGKDFVVVGIDEVLARRQVGLELWG